MNKHTFAVCAYKESEYLEECIRSVKGQSVSTNVIVATSTPNLYIQGLCEKYDIPLYINEGECGITQDWNFAYKKAESEYVTIAHQDDVYDTHYVKEMMDMLQTATKPIIFFSDYGEIRNGKFVIKNNLLTIKRIMLLPLRFNLLWKSRFVRRRILSLGSPICCPSVTFVKDNCPIQVFQHGFRADEDWEAWEMLSKRKGSFVYSPKKLVYHRIHGESETSKILEDNARTKEDLIMFCKFWPLPIAKILVKLYGTSEKSNKLS
ncbi:MAG: glycosyltransferase [Lachnospiraceae bacterium]|nr:glycosyltransferase [Lachnospiraceae bacterium]